MNRIYLLLIAFAFVFVACHSNKNDKYLIQGEILNFHSSILDEERQLLISLPKSIQYYEPDGIKYPVIYVLDGEDLFDYVKGMVNFLSESKSNDILPESIIIGIVNTNRNKDLTPNKISHDPNTGGGLQFSQFISEEVFPLIKQNYPVRDYRTIIGHSYGGLWTLNALIERPTLFNNYIAIDPSYQYLDHKSLDFEREDYANKNLFIGIANTFGIGQDTSNLNDTDDHLSHIKHLFKLVDDLEQKEQLKINFFHQYYEDDDHASLCVKATYDALRAIFSWYRFDSRQFRMSETNLSEEETMDQITKHTNLLSKHFGYPIKAPEKIIDQFAHSNSGRRTFALNLLKMNVKNYPKSYQAHLSLGRFYQMNGNYKKASESIEKALTIFEHKKVRQQLDEIQQKIKQ